MLKCLDVEVSCGSVAMWLCRYVEVSLCSCVIMWLGGDVVVSSYVASNGVVSSDVLS